MGGCRDVRGRAEGIPVRHWGFSLARVTEAPQGVDRPRRAGGSCSGRRGRQWASEALRPARGRRDPALHRPGTPPLLGRRSASIPLQSDPV
ncbi:hypothetical protein SCOCK_290061 [Actinacidiphila cocklensis]|uniref:Uncharacterized protein n=1 Tax=Actinacidiphila cocklensis TaxID=887465 RepID=A0A9W4DR51_9ACTN|nr:hypothetical protein SCOCK_290061 [Actinacidiphila cocklensis]